MDKSQVIPAGPGWYLIELLFDEGGRPYGLSENPIIAWQVRRVDDHVTPLPVTVDRAIDAADTGYAIKRPDSKYTIPNIRQCDDATTLVAELIALRQDENGNGDT